MKEKKEDPIRKLERVTKARHLDINALLKEYYSPDQSSTQNKKSKSPRKKK